MVIYNELTQEKNIELAHLENAHLVCFLVSIK